MKFKLLIIFVYFIFVQNAVHSEYLSLKAEPTFANQNIFSVLEYGADSTGIADSSPAFQLAFNALLTKGYGTLYMPHGNYLLNKQVDITGGGMLFEIKGDGVNKTFIKCNNKVGGIKIYSNNRTSQITIHDFTLIPMLQKSGTAFEYSMIPGGNRENRSCIMENLNVITERGNSFSVGLNLSGHWRQLVKAVSVSGSPFATTPVMTIGIDVSGSYTPRVINCNVKYANEGIVYITTAGQSGDFVGNNATLCNTGIKLSENSGVQPHLNVENNSFDCFKFGLKLESRKIIFVKNNTFANINAPKDSVYNDLFISLTDAANQPVDNILIVNNKFEKGFNPKRVMIYLGTKCSDIFIRKNIFEGPGTPLSNPNNTPNTVFENNSVVNSADNKIFLDERFDFYNIAASSLSDVGTGWLVNPNQNNGSAPIISSASSLGFPASVTKVVTLKEQFSVVSTSKYRMDGKLLSYNYENVTGSQTLYAALLVQVTGVGTGTTTGSWFFALGESTFAKSGGKIYAVGSGAGYKFALAKSVDASKVVETSGHSFGSTQILVLKYTPNSTSAKDDVVSLYVNPDLKAVEPVTATIVSNETIGSDFVSTDILSAILFQKGPGVRVAGMFMTNAWSEIQSVFTAIPTLKADKTVVTFIGGKLNTSSPGQLKIYSLQGAELFYVKTSGSVKVDLPKGIYIAKFKSETGIESVNKVMCWSVYERLN
jgi:hypothetical protein